MLILTRRPNQSIMINDDIVITYIGPGTENNTPVKIGINAPQSVKVHREEIYNKIKKEEEENKEKIID